MPGSESLLQLHVSSLFKDSDGQISGSWSNFEHFVCGTSLLHLDSIREKRMAYQAGGRSYDPLRSYHTDTYYPVRATY